MGATQSQAQSNRPMYRARLTPWETRAMQTRRTGRVSAGTMTLLIRCRFCASNMELPFSTSEKPR